VIRRAYLTRVASAGVLGLLIAACGQPVVSPGPAATAYPASPVDGVIIAIDASSIADVRGFTLLTATGQRITFTLGNLENPTAFPPGHLVEHEATSLPVRVYYRLEGSLPVVYRLEDAPLPGGTPKASPAAT